MFIHYIKNNKPANGEYAWIWRVTDNRQSPPGYRLLVTDRDENGLKRALRIIVQAYGVEALQCEEAIVAYTLDRLMNHD